MQRIGIYGGSFNPVHFGHVGLAKWIIENSDLDELWFLISPNNPLKSVQSLAPEQERLAAVQQAIQDIPRLKACDFEFALPRPSYTLNTLNALDNAFPGNEFLLLIGADNWEKFDRWYKGDEILSRHGVIVYPRGSEEEPPLPPGVQWMPAKLHDVSSTMVRAAVAAGEDIASLVPHAVVDFIKEHKMYIK